MPSVQQSALQLVSGAGATLPCTSQPLIISDIVLGDGGLDSAARPRLGRRLSIMAITALSRTSVISWDNFINMPSHHNLATKWK